MKTRNPANRSKRFKRPARFHIGPVLVFLFLAVCLSTARATESGSADAFKKVLLQILAVRYDPALQTPDKSHIQKAKIRALVDSIYDWDLINPLILRRTWPALSPEEKARLEPIATWAIKWKLIGKLFKYDVRDVVFTEEGPEGDRYFLEAWLGGGWISHPVRFVLVHQKDGHWAAVDTIVHGFSLIGHYRRKFDDTYFRKGLDGLIEHLNREVQEEFEEVGCTPEDPPR
ncbi:MAG: ABC transporter substrate-binding protein [Proteobacteria bacterium]|nr:ABC transporter substrate-binding protein [Pseudomonadota bacterium]